MEAIVDVFIDLGPAGVIHHAGIAAGDADALSAEVGPTCAIVGDVADVIEAILLILDIGIAMGVIGDRGDFPEVIGDVNRGDALVLFADTARDLDRVHAFNRRKDVEGFRKTWADAEGIEESAFGVEATAEGDFRMEFDPTLVRGMSYYTGPIFEIAMEEYGGSVGGGGRYDEMIGKFTGQPTPAVGFSIGFERIVMLLLENDFQVPGSGEKKAYLIEKGMPAEKMKKILELAGAERREGKIVNISIMKKNKKFQKEKMQQEGYTDFVEFFTDREF